MKKIVRFLASVRNEAVKVKWPTKKEMVTNSTATLTIVGILIVFFAILDVILTVVKMVNS